MAQLYGGQEEFSELGDSVKPDVADAVTPVAAPVRAILLFAYVRGGVSGQSG
jgi:hypothetical protein